MAQANRNQDAVKSWETKGRTGMDDLLSEFLTETAEGLEVLDVELVKLEQTPNDPTLLGNIFRIVHTIKGTCGFLGLPRLEAVAHAGENVLGKYRDGEVEVTEDSVSLILEALDRIKSILAVLEETETEPEGDDSDLIARLNAAAEGGAPAEAAPPAEVEAPVQPEEPAGDDGAAEQPVTAETAEAADTAEPAEPAPADTPAAELSDAGAEAKPAEPPAPAAPKPAAQQPDKGGEEAPPESSVAAQTIRVHVDLLENLMTMVSELVLTRNQLMQIMRGREDAELAAPLQRLNHVTSELQEGVMKTRMQPIGNAWSKLPRIVRDLGRELGKKFELQMKGEETELDRQILELIRDPLTHMVRNSCDHGIEAPEDRLAAGKKETGRILLDAHHEGGHIIIRIVDDGRGLNLQKIKDKVVANGVASEAELASMTDQQIQQFIFNAGLSTAAEVTSVSGRGVGMDVVKTNIEKIGGTIELNSTEGQGSSFTIKIPLTLAIVNALIVEVGGERFAIPQLSVTELVRTGDSAERRLEEINGVPVLRLRERLLPLVSLRKLMRLGDAPVAPKEANGSDSGVDEDGSVAALTNGKDTQESFIVVCQVGTYNFGIIVDRVFDTEEIVVKPVAPILRDMTLFSGNTILGDGSVIMILDPNGIAMASGEVGTAETEAAEDAERSEAGSSERIALLLFHAGGDTPKAVPLALVARLEEIDVEKIERSNDQAVVQYRDQLMPLVTVDQSYEIRSEGRQPVVVFSDRDRSMGLVVDEIVDIVEDVLDVELPSRSENGILGSAVISDKATDIIDVGFFLGNAFDDWFGSEEGPTFDSEGEGRRVLLVDDSPFFRNLLTPLLSVAGYQVTTVDCADAAMQLCEAGKQFDVIISDIEMPGMNGFEFAQAVKSSETWADTPIVALSSFASQSDLQRGRDAGFNDYVAKFDRDALLHSLNETLTVQRGAA